MDLEFEDYRDWFIEGKDLIGNNRMREENVRLFVCGILKGLMEFGYGECVYKIAEGEFEFNKLYKGMYEDGKL